MTTQPYLTWSITEERQRHEWLRLRRSVMAVRLSFVIGGHISYFAFCALAHHFGCFEQYGHSFWVGCWSMALIGFSLFLLETCYTRFSHIARPRFTIRKNGLTAYGEDGPAAHYDWRRTRVLHIENDPARPEYRSLILCEPRRFRWMRQAGRVAIPLPSPEDKISDDPVDETHIVAAIRNAIEDSGLKWVTAESGEVVLC